MGKIATLDGIRGGEEGFPVELWRDDDSGRLELVVYAEAGYSAVGIDLLDVASWLSTADGRRFTADSGST